MRILYTYIYIWDPYSVTTVPADGLAPDGVRPLAAAELDMFTSKFLCLSMSLYRLSEYDDVIQNGRWHFEKSCCTSSDKVPVQDTLGSIYAQSKTLRVKLLGVKSGYHCACRCSNTQWCQAISKHIVDNSIICFNAHPINMRIWLFLVFWWPNDIIQYFGPDLTRRCPWSLGVNSLWPSDAIWHQTSGSTLAQVMAWCRQAPSHYLNQYWLTIS